jgi:hypothetical protein
MDYLRQASIDKIFDEGQAQNGGVVRRSIASVKKADSEELLVEAVKERGFHLVKTETQYLIFCRTGAMNLTILI